MGRLLGMRGRRYREIAWRRVGKVLRLRRFHRRLQTMRGLVLHDGHSKQVFEIRRQLILQIAVGLMVSETRKFMFAASLRIETSFDWL